MNTQNNQGFWQQIRSFSPNYWVACFMELLERLSYFSVRAITPLYLIRSSSENGLGLNFTQKGYIFFFWALLQCLIPMVSGGYTDRYGYRKSLFLSFTFTSIGYLGMAQCLTITNALAQNNHSGVGFWVFLSAACFVAIGTAIFKPAIQGAIARSINENQSSLGWGTFYWIVNIGSALALMSAALLRSEMDWNKVFYAAAIITWINFLPALFLFSEPLKQESKGDPDRTIVKVFISSIQTIVKDKKLLYLLACYSFFWFMFMQLWDLLPNFIDEWVNTSDVAGIFGWLKSGWVLENGQTKPEMIISINSISVVIFVIPISWMIRRMSKSYAMTIGMVVSILGIVGAGATPIGWSCCLMIFVFSLGEMMCSPTFCAFIDSIAPKEKKALYMGYSNIPFAIGWAFGSAISGILYDNLSSKANLAKEYMVGRLMMDPEIIHDPSRLPTDQIFATLASKLGKDPATVTQILWNEYHPYVIWFYLGAIGLVAVVGMIFYPWKNKAN